MNSKVTSRYISLTRLTFLGLICAAIAACSNAPTTSTQPPPSHAYAPFSHKLTELELSLIHI